VAASVPLLETIPYIRPSNNASPMFAKLQNLILAHNFPFFIGHIHAHSGLPGPLSEGNNIVDQATQVIASALSITPLAAAQQVHDLHHLNAHTLRLKFSITHEQARQIVQQCKGCLTLLPEPHVGVNTRGLISGELWQMDVTNYSPFGKLKYIHVSVDTFSGFTCASLQTGEATKHVISYVLSCLVAVPQSKILKTDNGPGYASASFKQFCAQMGIKHITGIPYNPQGQGILERTHQTLKNMLFKLQSGEGGKFYILSLVTPRHF
jgi:transposase InsO family protein